MGSEDCSARRFVLMKLVKVSIAVRCCDIAIKVVSTVGEGWVGAYVVKVECGADWEKLSGRDWRAVWVA